MLKVLAGYKVSMYDHNASFRKVLAIDNKWSKGYFLLNKGKFSYGILIDLVFTGN